MLSSMFCPGGKEEACRKALGGILMGSSSCGMCVLELARLVTPSHHTL